jgi:hypothetical protein
LTLKSTLTTAVGEAKRKKLGQWMIVGENGVARSGKLDESRTITWLPDAGPLQYWLPHVLRRCSSSGSLAMLVAMRRASSLVS